jgi:hypothetical protein
MKKRLSIYSLVVGLCLLANSCFREGDLDFKNIRFTDNFVYDLPIPLVDSRLTLVDLLRNFQGQSGMVIADPSSGLMKIVYQKDTLFGFSDLGISVPDQSFNLSTSLTIPPFGSFPPDADSTLLTGTFSVRLALLHSTIFDPNFRLDTIQVESLDFQLPISTGIRNKVRIELSSSNLMDSFGRPFSVSTLLPGANSGNQQDFIRETLSNYRIIPDNSVSTLLHQLKFDYTVTIFKNEAETTSYSAPLNMYADFKKVNMDLIYGYFGYNVHLPIPDNTVDLSVLNKFPLEVLEVKNADMIFSIANGFGVPIRANAAISLFTDNSVESETFSPLLGQPASPVAPPVDTTLQKNIQSLSLISDNSGKLSYQMQYSTVRITMNPPGAPPPTSLNFLSKNSFVKMGIGIEIPLQLRLAGLTVSDTVNFAGLPFTDGIEFFTIKANVHNAFPLEAAVSLHFLDSLGAVIDSVKITDIEGALVHPSNGNVVEPSFTPIEINLSESQIKNLVVTRQFLIKGILNTSDYKSGVMVNIYENSETEGYLRVMIGCRLKASGKLISSFSDLVDHVKK